MLRSVIRLFLTAATALVCGVARPAEAWNRTGHKVVAYIAYNRLSPRAKENVVKLIRRHPDYAMLSATYPGAFGDEALRAFLEAATWPDRIREDARFYDESRKGAAPPPLLPGFPDMKFHLSWHFVDNYFSQDGTPIPPGKPPGDALVQIESIRRALADLSIPEAHRAYDLSWLLHIVGDVHQPLHCVARFTRHQKNPPNGAYIGDLGGNTVFVEGGGTLHQHWDFALGDREDQRSLARLAKEISPQTMPPSVTGAPPDEWVKEGFDIARNSVYQFDGVGSKSSPVRLDRAYRTTMARTAQQRAAIAGFRLAKVLEDLFGR